MKKGHKQQFCKYGHDMFICGQNTQGQCVICAHTRNARYRKANPDKSRERNWVYIFNTDGTRFKMCNYTQLFTEQNGRCAICQKHNTELTRVLHVDHDHTTGMVRGLLCDSCNKVLGFVQNRPEVLITAANYLLKEKR